MCELSVLMLMAMILRYNKIELNYFFLVPSDFLPHSQKIEILFWFLFKGISQQNTHINHKMTTPTTITFDACGCSVVKDGQDHNEAVCDDNGENCEEELTCKRCGVVDADVQGGLCDDCFSTMPMDRFVRIDDNEWAGNDKKQKLTIVCEHIYECGCEKDICEWCVENYDYENDEGEPCDDENCHMYYENRNDNCDCHGARCPYCNARN